MIGNMTTSMTSELKRALVPPAISAYTLRVSADDRNIPLSVNIRGQWIKVRSVVNTWLIEDEWSSEQANRRMYYDCLMSRGLRIAVFHDLDSNLWYW